MPFLETKPYALNPQEGLSLLPMGAKVYVKATSDQTGGIFNLFDVTCPPGFATPLHIHYAEDVAIFVLEGALTFFCGSEKMHAAPGSYFFQPRGTPHGFRGESSLPARILYITIPAGFDRFVIEQARQTPGVETETSAARYKIEILGPLPERPRNAAKKW